MMYLFQKRGFTLIEVLVVVLIIAVLAAVAVPQYQRAVLKSRFAALMPIGKSMANSNEAYYLEHGFYADTPQELPVEGRSSYPDGTAVTLADDENYSYVFVGNETALPHNNYIVYQKHSTQFPDNIHCEAHKDDDNAKAVCESLGGQLLPTGGSQTDNFITYVLQGNTVGSRFVPSITKLKAQICAGISDANCIVDEKNNTITTQECGESITYNNGGSQVTGSGCSKTVYDENGTVTGQSTTVCGSSDRATWDGEKCVPNKQYYYVSDSDAYELTYDENGNRIERKMCLRYSDSSGCFEISDEHYNENGIQTSYKSRKCSNGAINPVTMTCPGNEYSDSADMIMDSQGRLSELYGCSVVNSLTGDCTQYKVETSYNTTYGANYGVNGNQDTTRTNCTEWTGTRCTGTWEIQYRRVGDNWIICNDGYATATGVCSTGRWRTNNGYCTKDATANLETLTCN